MLQISDKAKFQIKKTFLLGILFFTLFFSGFYIVNLLDIKPAPKQILQVTSSVQDFKLKDEELKKRTSADGINFAEFQDWAVVNGLSVGDKNVYDGDPDKDGLLNFAEYIHGTDPNNADTDGDKFSDKQEITNGYDPDAPGDAKPTVLVGIEKIKVEAPMIWSQSEDGEKTLKDLEGGLSHFPKSAAPGEKGNALISGHSSNYLWSKGDYNYVFKNLNDVAIGDVVMIKTVQKNGRVLTFKYVINEKFITTPDDEKIFASSEKPVITLSTCWPLGTNFKRLIVKAELAKP